jgi:hypothetical protein
VGVRDEDEHRLVRKWLPDLPAPLLPQAGAMVRSSSGGVRSIAGGERESVFNLEVEK